MLEDAGQTVRMAAAGVAFVGLLALCAFLIYPNDAHEALERGYYATARQYLYETAEAGDAGAQNALANLYYLGLGGAKDPAAAVQWYLKSAAQAHSPAQVNVARMYRLGLGVKRDVLRSFAWLLQAQQNGNKRAVLWMRPVVSGVALAPNQVILARETYRTLDTLMSGALPGQ